jgi:tRNA (mo5U34)-methyltransferase
MYNKRVRFGGIFAGLSASHKSMGVTFRVANRPWTMPYKFVRKALQSLRLLPREHSAVAAHSSVPLPSEVSAVDWYHTIDLGGGVVTPGVFDHRPILESYRLPARMDGLRVLDVATWDGFWAFEFERRGAKEVVALDIAKRGDVDLTPAVRRRMIATHGEDFLRSATGKGFEVARQRLGSSVTRRVLNVYDVSPETVGMFDVVHVGDVLLHLKYPWRALENVLSVTSGYAIISEPSVPELDTLGGGPLLRYLSGEEDTTWWNFSFEVLRKMILDAGFERIEVVNTFHFGGPYDHAVIHAFPKT